MVTGARASGTPLSVMDSVTRPDTVAGTGVGVGEGVGVGVGFGGVCVGFVLLPHEAAPQTTAASDATTSVSVRPRRTVDRGIAPPHPDEDTASTTRIDQKGDACRLIRGV